MPGAGLPSEGPTAERSNPSEVLLAPATLAEGEADSAEPQPRDAAAASKDELAEEGQEDCMEALRRAACACQADPSHAAAEEVAGALMQLLTVRGYGHKCPACNRMSP
jgi:hypothetical protein